MLTGVRGKPPGNASTEKFQTDPHWRDHSLFFEYFHGNCKREDRIF
jgi:hypothetical protein